MRRAGRHLAALGLLGALATGCSGDDDRAAPTPETSATTPPPTSAPTTTEAPLTGDALVVAEQGLSTFPDPIDPLATLGGYGVVLENPNDDVMATGVRVVTRILDATGTELLVDRSVLNAVMPGEQMAVGRTLIEPIVDPTQLEVEVEVGAWLLPASATGALVATDVATQPVPDGGVVTTFTVSSTWPTSEDAVDVTAVYRAADGRILGAESTALDVVLPGRDQTGQIPLLSPIPDLATTVVFVGRGFAAQTLG